MLDFPVIALKFPFEVTRVVDNICGLLQPATPPVTVNQLENTKMIRRSGGGGGLRQPSPPSRILQETHYSVLERRGC